MMSRVADLIRHATTVAVEFAIFCTVFNTIVHLLLRATS